MRSSREPVDSTRGWICVALYLVGITAILPIVRHYNPTLMEAREQWRHKDTQRFDKIFLAALLPLVFIQPAVAGLDAVRFHWSLMPLVFVYVGTILFALAIALIAWSMAVNPYAETTVPNSGGSGP